MSRAARALVLSFGIGAAAGTMTLAGPVGATPPTPPPSTLAVTTTTVAAAPTTVAAPPVTRGDATEGSVAKPQDETWTVRRIATLTALAVIALAAAGYAYGRVRSAPPRHPDLERHPDDLDGVDHPHVGAAG